jgi:hypothetical protein
MNKKLIYTLVTGILLILPVQGFAQFNDVDSSTNYSEAIDYLQKEGVVEGYSDGSFKPNNCVNRAELLKMLMKSQPVILYDNMGPWSGYFSDVDENAWYWNTLKSALTLGIVKGYPDGTFRPNNCVNRVEAIKMGLITFGIPTTNNGYAGISILLNSYKDIDQNAWYFKYFESALINHLIGLDHVREIENDDSAAGVDRYFYPAGNMSRAEVAEMLYQIQAYVEARS